MSAPAIHGEVAFGLIGDRKIREAVRPKLLRQIYELPVPVDAAAPQAADEHQTLGNNRGRIAARHRDDTFDSNHPARHGLLQPC